LLSAVASAAATTVAAATAAVTTATATTAAAVTTATAGTLASAHLVEAVAAVDRAVTTRLERHLGRLTTAAAYDVEKLTLRARCTTEATSVATVSVSAPGTAAVAAALRLRESPLGVKFLVICGKDELRTAVDAG
jgi:hypothetical protein